MFRNTLGVPSSYLPGSEDGTDKVFRNVGILTSDAGESSRRKHTTFATRRHFEIKNNRLHCWPASIGRDSGVTRNYLFCILSGPFAKFKMSVLYFGSFRLNIFL
jgi:hypothetical protein